MNKHKYNSYDTTLLVLIGITTIIVCIAIIYRFYRKIDAFANANTSISKINPLDTTLEANMVALRNDYVGIMSDAYNKMTLQDEHAIQNLYNDSIANSNIISALSAKLNIQKNSAKTSFPVGSFIKTIKSKNNAQTLSLASNDPEGKYSVNVNDKCLTVSGTCDNNSPYCTQDCQNILYTSDSQKFEVSNIATVADAKKIMGPHANISSANVYPFNVLRSVVDNTCLSMSNSGVSLEPCNLNDIRHQWSISPDENICLMA
uniref:Uncharacterized protein n=1 Tax=viral metagenome TaxID=1070528 RepID=A0A6C0HM57_9ZZZZ